MSDLPPLPPPDLIWHLPDVSLSGYRGETTQAYARAAIASLEAKLAASQLQTKQADERGDEAMRRTHKAEAKLAEIHSIATHNLRGWSDWNRVAAIAQENKHG